MRAPFLLAALAGCSHVVRANVAPAFVACYSNPGTLKKKDTDPHQSSGVCHTTCVNIKLPNDVLGYSVMGMTSSTDCYCGQYLPNSGLEMLDTGHLAWEEASVQYAAIITAWINGGYLAGSLAMGHT